MVLVNASDTTGPTRIVIGSRYISHRGERCPENLLVRPGGFPRKLAPRCPQRIHDLLKIRHVIDQRADPLLEFDNSNVPELQPKIAPLSANIVPW